MTLRILLLHLCFACFATLGHAKEVPAFSALVTDEVNLLSPEVRDKLEGALRDFQKTSGNQLAVYITETLDGEPLEAYANRVFHQWGIGGAKEDNGLLFLVAVKDRKMRIEVGQGLEGQLTDVQSGRILRTTQKYFKEGHYPEGVLYTLDSMAHALGGKLNFENDFRERLQGESGSNMGLAGPLILFFFILIFSMFFGRRRSTPYFFYGGGGGFGGGGSSGGGGFGGSGGGDSSGGGASSDW